MTKKKDKSETSTKQELLEKIGELSAANVRLIREAHAHHDHLRECQIVCDCLRTQLEGKEHQYDLMLAKHEKDLKNLTIALSNNKDLEIQVALTAAKKELELFKEEYHHFIKCVWTCTRAPDAKVGMTLVGILVESLPQPARNARHTNKGEKDDD